MIKAKHDNTRAIILETARDMFFTMEYSKVTLNEIARRVGVTKGGIYHYFDGKDDLLVAVLSETFDQLLAASMVGISKAESLYAVLEDWFNFSEHLSSMTSEDDKSSYGPMFQMLYLLMVAVRKRKEVIKQLGRIYNIGAVEMEALITKAQGRGEIRKDLDPKALALQLLVIVEGGMLVSVVREDDDLRGTADMLFKNIWLQIKA